MKISAQGIKDRLRRIAKESGHPYNFVFERYTQERALYRLSVSPHASRFMLKGGLYLAAITDTFARATHDVDLEAYADADPQAMKSLFQDAFSVEASPDALRFDASAIMATQIKEQDEYSGVRVLVPGAFGDQAFRVQIDVGVGDPVVLPLQQFTYPVLLDALPAPTIRAYSIESVIAEKLEAITSLGEVNSRYKDFDDIVQLSERFDFSAAGIHLACQLTFNARTTPFADLPKAIAISNASEERERHWRAYVRREHATTRSGSFAECLKHLQEFVDGVMAFNNDGLDRTWDRRGRRWLTHVDAVSV